MNANHVGGGTWQGTFAGTNSFPGLMKVSGFKVIVRGFHGTPLSPSLVRTYEHTHARKHTLWPNRQQTIHAEAKWMCEGRNCQCCCLEDRKSSRNISRKSRCENEWKWKVVSTLPSPSPVYERIKMVDEISLAYNDEEDVWNIWKICWSEVELNFLIKHLHKYNSRLILMMFILCERWY